MERPIIELTLPECQARVILYQFLVNGEYREIQRSLLKDVKIDTKNPEQVEIGELSGQFALDQQDLTLSFLIKEIFTQDGTKVEDTKAFVYTLSVDDASILYEKINELSEASKLTKEAKKK